MKCSKYWERIYLSLPLSKDSYTKKELLCYRSPPWELHQAGGLAPVADQSTQDSDKYLTKLTFLFSLLGAHVSFLKVVHSLLFPSLQSLLPIKVMFWVEF